MSPVILPQIGREGNRRRAQEIGSRTLFVASNGGLTDPGNEFACRKILVLCAVFFTAGALSHVLLDFGVAKLVRRSFRLKR